MLEPVLACGGGTPSGWMFWARGHLGPSGHLRPSGRLGPSGRLVGLRPSGHLGHEALDKLQPIVVVDAPQRAGLDQLHAVAVAPRRLLARAYTGARRRRRHQPPSARESPLRGGWRCPGRPICSTPAARRSCSARRSCTRGARARRPDRADKNPKCMQGLDAGVAQHVALQRLAVALVVVGAVRDVVLQRGILGRVDVGHDVVVAARQCCVFGARPCPRCRRVVARASFLEALRLSLEAPLSAPELRRSTLFAAASTSAKRACRMPS